MLHPGVIYISAAGWNYSSEVSKNHMGLSMDEEGYHHHDPVHLR